MNEIQHRDLAASRWCELSLFEQLGNIGSEVSRAARWQACRPEMARAVVYRALELFDVTLADARLIANPARLREVARAREGVADFFEGPNAYGSTAALLQRYFDAFAVAANQLKQKRI